MSRRLRSVAALTTAGTVVVSVLVAGTSPASGAREIETPFTATTGVPAGGVSGGSASDGDRSEGSNDGCGPWEVVFRNLPGSDIRNDTPLYELEEFRAAVAESPDGTASLLQRWCGDETEEVWVADGASGQPAVTVDSLVPGARDEAVGYIGLPVIALAPPVSQGGLVNVPMWLAVEPAGPYSARAQVGSVWAQVDAALSGVSWDMGTGGELVECEGSGTIWTPGDTSGGTGGPGGEWPLSPDCGFTYEAASFPEYTPDGASAYHVTVTAHWALRLTGSDGRDVALDPVEVPFRFDYVVHELQTVGVAD